MCFVVVLIVLLRQSFNRGMAFHHFRFWSLSEQIFLRECIIFLTTISLCTLIYGCFDEVFIFFILKFLHNVKKFNKNSFRSSQRTIYGQSWLHIISLKNQWVIVWEVLSFRADISTHLECISTAIAKWWYGAVIFLSISEIKSMDIIWKGNNPFLVGYNLFRGWNIGLFI